MKEKKNTKQNKTKQNKTKQNKTKQNKTKQNNRTGKKEKKRKKEKIKTYHGTPGPGQGAFTPCGSGSSPSFSPSCSILSITAFDTRTAGGARTDTARAGGAENV
jgi:hypothetical protein